MVTSTRQICILNNKNISFAHLPLNACVFVFVHFAAIPVLSETLNGLFCSCLDDDTVALDDTFKWSFYHHTAHTNLGPGYLGRLGIIAKRLQRCKVTFSDDVLAVVNIARRILLITSFQKCSCSI